MSYLKMLDCGCVTQTFIIESVIKILHTEYAWPEGEKLECETKNRLNIFGGRGSLEWVGDVTANQHF